MCRQLRLRRFRRPMKLDGGERQRGSRSIITDASVTVVGGGVGLERRWWDYWVCLQIQPRKEKRTTMKMKSMNKTKVQMGWSILNFMFQMGCVFQNFMFLWNWMLCGLQNSLIAFLAWVRKKHGRKEEENHVLLLDNGNKKKKNQFFFSFFISFSIFLIFNFFFNYLI